MNALTFVFYGALAVAAIIVGFWVAQRSRGRPLSRASMRVLGIVLVVAGVLGLASVGLPILLLGVGVLGFSFKRRS